jgi:dipeptidyl aminopeptidase/acylaminoacyl peptidase
VRDVIPSPVDRRLALVRQGVDSLSPFEEYVLDLATLQPRRRISADDWFSWMPDGRFMLISLKTGRMRIASVDGADEVPVGRLTPPADRAMGAFTVSPTGRQFIMRMMRRGSMPKESDLWIGNIDGSGFEQLTDAKVVTGAVWSPDGRQVAYEVDTGHFCSTAGYCIGRCDQYYTPAGLRRVKGLDHQPGSATFSVRDRDGNTKALGCSVLAWTP